MGLESRILTTLAHALSASLINYGLTKTGSASMEDAFQQINTQVLNPTGRRDQMGSPVFIGGSENYEESLAAKSGQFAGQGAASGRRADSARYGALFTAQRAFGGQWRPGSTLKQLNHGGPSDVAAMPRSDLRIRWTGGFRVDPKRTAQWWKWAKGWRGKQQLQIWCGRGAFSVRERKSYEIGREPGISRFSTRY